MRLPTILSPLVLLVACGGRAPAKPAQSPEPEKPPVAATEANKPEPEAKKPERATPATAEHVQLADGDLATIASPCGVYIVISWRGSTVRGLLAAREVKTMNPPNPKIWLLDGVLTELSVVAASQLEAEKLRGKPLLDHYRGWELGWAAKRNGWAVPEAQVFMSEQTRPGSGLAAQVWAFSAPGKMDVLGVPVTGMSYATVAIDDLILTTAVPFRPGDDPQRALGLFVSLFRTIQQERGAPDVAALSRQVRDESVAEPSCKLVHGG